MDHKKNRNSLLQALQTRNGTSNQATLNHGKGASSLVIPEKTGKPIGHLTIEKVFADGKTEKVVDDKNLVVTQAETIMAQMSLGLRQMSYIEIGDANPVTAPDLGDLALESTLGLRQAITGSFTGNTAVYEATFGIAEANGSAITEAGLFSTPFATGLMFSRKTFAAINKTAAFSLKFTWAIVYQVSDAGNGCSGVALLGNSIVTEDFVFTASGGETELVIPISFVPGTKSLDVFLQGQRLIFGIQYNESVLVGGNGITFTGFSLLAGNRVYIVKRGT